MSKILKTKTINVWIQLTEFAFSLSASLISDGNDRFSPSASFTFSFLENVGSTKAQRYWG